MDQLSEMDLGITVEIMWKPHPCELLISRSAVFHFLICLMFEDSRQYKVVITSMAISKRKSCSYWDPDSKRPGYSIHSSLRGT